jgi:hypothetical protein
MFVVLLSQLCNYTVDLKVLDFKKLRQIGLEIIDEYIGDSSANFLQLVYAKNIRACILNQMGKTEETIDQYQELY